MAGRKSGQEYEWPPTNVPTTFEELRKKLLELQKREASTEELLAVIDWWIGKLFELRSSVGARRKI